VAGPELGKFNAPDDRDDLPADVALDAEARAQARMAQSDDHLDRVMAFAGERDPKFRRR
jgi:hypothetical protein